MKKIIIVLIILNVIGLFSMYKLKAMGDGYVQENIECSKLYRKQFENYFFKVIEPTIENFDEQKTIFKEMQDSQQKNQFMAPILKISGRLNDYFSYNLSSQENTYLSESVLEEYDIFRKIPMGAPMLSSMTTDDFYLYFQDQIFSKQPTSPTNSKYLEILETIKSLKDYYESTAP